MELRASICEVPAIADTAGQLQSVSFQSITVRIRVRARRVRGIVRVRARMRITARMRMKMMRR